MAAAATPQRIALSRQPAQIHMLSRDTLAGSAGPAALRLAHGIHGCLP